MKNHETVLVKLKRGHKFG